MRRRHTLTAIAAAAVLALGASACSSNNSSSTTTEQTSTTTGVTLPQNFSVSTPEGQVSLSLDGKLPPGWPNNFPLPDNTEAAGSGSLGGSDNTVRVGVYRTSQSGEQTLDFYSQNQSLETSGRSGAGIGDNYAGRLNLTSPYSGSVNVLSIQGTTYMVVVLKGDTNASTTSTTAPGATSTTAPAASTTTTMAPNTPQ